MFRIFANYVHTTSAPNDAALGTSLANRGANFHDKHLLAFRTAKVLIIQVITYYVQCKRTLPDKSWDSQDEGISFGDSHGMLKMGRQ